VRDTIPKDKEIITMKPVRALIEEARAKKNDVIIENEEGCWTEMFGGGWTAEGEYGWYEEENAFDDCEVVKVSKLDEGITFITVEKK
jgi:hypothetical protein